MQYRLVIHVPQGQIDVVRFEATTAWPQLPLYQAIGALGSTATLVVALGSTNHDERSIDGHRWLIARLVNANGRMVRTYR